MLKWNGKKILKAIEGALPDPAKKIAENVARDARALVPVDTGALRESIKVRESKFKNGGYLVTAGGGDEYYAKFVELGAPATQTKKGKSRTPTEARPFLRPAAEVNRHRTPGMIFANNIKKALS